MTSERTKLPHEDRTVKEPRSGDMVPVILDRVLRINDTIRLFKLGVLDQAKGIKFLPGQWLDVHIPTLPKAGGFTITSTPADASASKSTNSNKPLPYLELAVQKSSENPPAAWLWQEPDSILNQELRVRVGGSFTWPPRSIDERAMKKITKVVFVAGGVGINPLISMLSQIHQTFANSSLQKIDFLYTTKAPLSEGSSDFGIINPAEILFLPRLVRIKDALTTKMHLKLFITGECGGFKQGFAMPRHVNRRISETDLKDAVGNDGNTVCFVCGPPGMTDEIVLFLGGLVGKEKVFCEKWW